MVSVTRRRSRAVSSCLMMGVALSAQFVASVSFAQEQELPASDALPGIYRVGIARTAPAALAGTLGYGFSEAQNAADGTHHRLSLRAAAAVPVVDWLSIGALIDGRYDQHPNDSGALADTALQARAFTTLGNWQLGAGVLGRLPGAEDLSTMVSSTSVEGQALLATTVGRVRIASLIGYRSNHGGPAGRDAARLSSGDRLALGLSQFDAALLGLGVGVWVGENELLGEVSSDVLVGRGAPVGQSPLRVAAGVRRAVAGGLSLEFMAVGSLSRQPDLSPSAPLVANEPRLSVFASIRYQFLSHVPLPTRPNTELVAPPRARGVRLELTINDDQGVPVPNPSVFVIIDEQRREASCDASGQCTLDDVKPGDVLVHIEAPTFEPREQLVSVRADAPAQIAMRLVAVPPPSQLRGVVRSLDGKGVVARVRVEPLGTQASVDAKGYFQLDLPPGGYDVVIEASGYVAQRRHVQVEPKGVVVLNAELVRAP